MSVVNFSGLRGQVFVVLLNGQLNTNGLWCRWCVQGAERTCTNYSLAFSGKQIIRSDTKVLFLEKLS